MLSSNRWLIASAVLLPAALLALAGWLNYRQHFAEALHNAESSTAALSEHALRSMRAHELIIDFVDHAVAGKSWPQIVGSADLHRLLVRLVKSGGADVSSIFLVDPTGNTWMSSRRFPMPSIPGADRDYFTALRDGAQRYISIVQRGRLSDDRFFSLARRRSSGGGHFDGVIGVSVNPEYFEKFYATLVETPLDSVSLIRADGTVLARHPDLDRPLKLPADGSFIRALAEDPVSGSFSGRSSSDGQERIFAYRRVGDYPLYTAYNLSTDVIWDAWRRDMLPYALACLLAGAMLLVGASLAEQRTRRAAAEARGREAEEASRSKDRFVAALSHELRNPLAAISLANEVLEHQNLEGEAAGSLAVIRRQERQLRRMLDDLLDTSRAVYGKLGVDKRRVELRAVAKTVVDDQQARAGSARLSLEGEEAWVDADPVRLSQMIENLVDNAVKYGGQRIRVRVRKEGETVLVRVEDDGQGIAPELMPQLFQPFVQGEQPLDRAKGGLGLGLALVERLAALHGGTLTAQSDGPGKGAAFVLRLPMARSGARAEEAAAVLRAKAEGGEWSERRSRGATVRR